MGPTAWMPRRRAGSGFAVAAAERSKRPAPLSQPVAESPGKDPGDRGRRLGNSLDDADGGHVRTQDSHEQGGQQAVDEF